MDVATVPSETVPFLFHRVASPHRRLRVSVILPVRNEASHLKDTLAALANQVDADGKPLAPGVYEVLLLANNCTDDSAAIARCCRQTFPALTLHVEDVTLSPGKSTVGQVRRMLMDEACRRLRAINGKGGIIASTDGDTVVDGQWVHQIITEIDKGNDAVGGRILTRTTKHAARQYYLRDVMYRTLLAKAETVLDPVAHDAWPTHFQYFGANFAVTCDAYVRAGRLPPVAYLEDVAFHQALLSVDAKVRKSNAVKVYTSARLRGKVEVGFAGQLQQWNEMALTNGVQLVEPAAASLFRFENRFLLRRCHSAFLQKGADAKELRAIAVKLSVCPDWFVGALKRCSYFGQLWQQTEVKMSEAHPSCKMEPIPITQAINELRLFLHKRQRG